MISKLREPFGKAGLTVAVVALVFALGGGAWALSASSGGRQQAKDFAKAKTRSHSRGARGPQGPVGPEGPEGPSGANGRNGTNGKNGVDGANGLPGKSVISGEEPAGENCELGGYWFEVQGSGSKQYVCNGTGGGGSTGGTELAPGDTETGVWSFIGQEESVYWINISFPLRLPPGVTKGGGAKCPGNAATPEAEPGYWCLYEAGIGNAFNAGGEYTSDNTSGLILEFLAVDETQQAYGRGTWAATAPCPEEEPTC